MMVIFYPADENYYIKLFELLNLLRDERKEGNLEQLFNFLGHALTLLDADHSKWICTSTMS